MATASCGDTADSGPISSFSSLSDDQGFVSLGSKKHKSWSPRDRREIHFVNVDKKYVCPLCQLVVESPVQNICGHIYCLFCVESELEKEPCGISCVVEEKCDKITRESLFPDFSVQREIQLLEVYCVNKPFGCTVIVAWLRLKKHESKCEFNAPRLECSLKHLGCLFRGDEDELERHQSNALEEHVKTFAEYVCAREFDLNSTVGELNQIKGECRELDATLMNLSTQSKALTKNKLSTLERKITAISQMAEKIDHRISTLETSCERHYAPVQAIALLDYELKQLGEKLQQINDTVRRLEREFNLPSHTSLGRFDAEVHRKLDTHAAHLRSNELKLAQAELRLNMNDCISNDGHVVWKIDDYKRRLREAKGGLVEYLHSPPFCTGYFGYKLAAKVFLNGDGQGKDTHLSFYIQMMQGSYDSVLKWPFQQKITLVLMSQQQGKGNFVDSFKPNPFASNFKRPETESNRATGCPLFARQSMVESKTFLKDDTIFLKVLVDVSDL